MRKIVQIRQYLQKEYPKFDISNEKIQKIEVFLRYLVEWNSKINLTSINDANELITKHLLDCMAFLKSESVDQIHASFSKGKTLDMGSGAGLPSLILAIFYPMSEFWSIDKSSKKIGFQKMVKAHIKLNNFNPIQNRLDTMTLQKEYQESFDTIVSRAFTQIKDLLSFCMFFLKEEGHAVFWKGARWEEEYRAVNEGVKHRFKLISRTKYEIKDSRFGGTILVLRKVK